jgi:hypothetical protein
MRRAGKQVAIAVTLALLFYLALNPASLMTSYEAKWFSYNPYASYSFSDFDLSKLSRIASFRIEWQMALVAISPLLIALIIASLFWRKCAQLLPLLVGAATGSGVVVVIHLINHFNRPHYYLPVFVGGVFLILKTLEQAVPRRSLAADFSGLALIIAAVVLHQSFFFETPGYSPAAPFRFNHKASSSWWMDIGLRPLISQAFAKENKIAFYDAISESPRDLAQRIGDSNSRVLAPCWSYPEISKDSMNSGSYASPIVNDWAEWARTHCSGFNEYTFNLTAAHHYGFYETLFVDVSAQDFSRVLASPHRIANSQSYFHPRLFKGSIEGIDIWIDHGNAMVFTKDFVLEQQFSFERMPRAVRLTSESTCKKPGELRLVAKQKLNGTPSTQSYAETSISVREPFCKYYSERYGFDICRVPGAVLDQFANWSIRFEPLAPIQVNLQGSGPWELKIAGKLSPGERCWVRVNPIEFIY